jgi:hypothetical protein
MSILWGLGTTLGMVARQYDLPMSEWEVSEGLVAPAAAVQLLRHNGAALLALLVSRRNTYIYIYIYVYVYIYIYHARNTHTHTHTRTGESSTCVYVLCMCA